MNSPIPVVKPIRISLIPPVYNVADYLHECLHICEEYSQQHPDLFKLVASEENQGVSVAHNIGLENTRVDYFMFVDLDNVLPGFKTEPATCVSACGVIRAIRTTSATHVSRGISAWGALMSLILPTFLLLKDSSV